MKFIKTKKGLALLAVVAVVAISAVGAYAYFTTSGTGTGHATVGSLGGNNFTVASPADTAADMVPSAIGSTNQVVDTINYTVTNTSESSTNVNKVVFSIDHTWTVQPNLSLPACTASDFSINGKPVANSSDSALTPVTVAPNAPLNAVSDGGNVYSSSYTLQLVDNGANQDNCEGAVVPITIVAS